MSSGRPRYSVFASMQEPIDFVERGCCRCLGESKEEVFKRLFKSLIEQIIERTEKSMIFCAIFLTFSLIYQPRPKAYESGKDFSIKLRSHSITQSKKWKCLKHDTPKTIIKLLS